LVSPRTSQYLDLLQRLGLHLGNRVMYYISPVMFAAAEGAVAVLLYTYVVYIMPEIMAASNIQVGSINLDRCELL
jgi:hypothetical protein